MQDTAIPGFFKDHARWRVDFDKLVIMVSPEYLVFRECKNMAGSLVG